MCDYSLEHQVSRAAQVGDTLVTTSFASSTTRGFCEEGKPGIAVCLLPGTELAFDEPVAVHDMLTVVRHDSLTARFRQVDMDQPATHHDAIELDDGAIVKLTNLKLGQRARVLQLPVTPDNVHPGKHKAELELVVIET